MLSVSGDFASYQLQIRRMVIEDDNNKGAHAIPEVLIILHAIR